MVKDGARLVRLKTKEYKHGTMLYISTNIKILPTREFI